MLYVDRRLARPLPARVASSRPARPALPARLACLLPAALALISLGLACSAPDESARDLPIPQERRVILLGMDGLDWEVLNPLMESGEVPGFVRLRDEGAWGELRSLEPLFSPIVWTSISTGQAPEDHGIRSFTVETAAGRIPVTSNLRRARTLWDILSALGRRVGVIGWWGSWPAEEVNGFLCSDRAWPITMGPEGWPVTSAGEDAAAGMQRRTYPEGLMAEIRPDLVFRDDLQEEQLSLVEVRGALGTTGGTGPSVADAYAKDISFQRIGRRLYEKRRPQFFSIYFDLTDVMAHYFWAHYKYYRSFAYGE
ncbi:MAG: hypothetical protein GF355_06040, partial [Candidatus Eisenbacteria bacterium]|nr:hypothetical protein [Candidatus Eisenbacteria bacterium]